LHPSKQRGQNFVTDPNTVRRIVRDAGVQPGDVVVEVGPGLGSLTLALLEAGAQVHAIEVDHGLAAALAEVVGSGVTITVADALAVSYAELIGDGPATMIANLPYNVATPILMTALREGALAGYHLMVQREVGQRWVASVGDPAYGAVSVKIALLAQARMAGSISRQAFHPIPNVESVTVSLTPYPHVLHDVVERTIALVDAGFSQRRKMLRNALATSARRPADIDMWLRSSDLPRDSRAEELTPQDWTRLAAVQ
jgi:16S rRNA (adenine1518-N6/adenine1519-N6)-dimethyltransferase